jgi:very-short-patch-repair endonuclease
MAVPSIDPLTAIVLGCAGTALLLLLAWFVRYISKPTVYIEPVTSLVTPAEQRFYEALDEAIDGRLMIMSKVRVADLLNVTSESRPARHRVFCSIACKHVDFVLVEPQNLRPLAAIELDDSTHQRADRRKRDELLDDLFKKAGFPLLRFKTSSVYSSRLIEVEVEEALARKSHEPKRS